ncbi:hypothetical protein GF325_18400, partial [Candidatus Bathyarchaeota archaeon]|nr:hypothetical protein [Candidatus Bathyarchaeota archaeon]
IMLGATVGFQGKIITYEIESSHHHAAVKNIQELGFQDTIEARMGNILDPATQSTIREDGPFDAIILDLPVPDQAVDLAWDILKPCGKLCSFMPVIEQVSRLVKKLKQGKWFDIEVVDVAVRKWQVRENATRPRNLGHHTGFILFATKINESPPLDWTRKNRKMLIRKLEAQGKIGKLEPGDMDFLDG